MVSRTKSYGMAKVALALVRYGMAKVALALALTTLLAACADDTGKLAVRGRLMGHDGTPLSGAYVSLQGQGDRVRNTTDADGRFSFAVDGPGGHWLWFAGIHHKTLLVPLLVDGPLDIDIRLAAANYLPEFNNVGVIGRFNNYSVEDGVVAMERQPDGTFAAEIATSKDSLYYQLIGVQGEEDPLAGTNADRYIFDRKRPLIGDRSGKYISAIGVTDGRARVTFDPNRLPRSDAEEQVIFADPSGAAARLVEIRRDIDRRTQGLIRAYEAHTEAGGDPAEFKYDWSEDRAALRQQIDSEKNEILRQYLLINMPRPGPAAEDSLLTRRVLEEIPPASPVWSLQWAGPLNTFYTIAGPSASADTMVVVYALRVVDEHTDPVVQSSFLFYLLSRARDEGDAELSNRYYSRLRDEFRDTDYARLAKSLWGPNRNIVVGEPVPKFTIASLHDRRITYTDEALSDHVYLIDFWATWCGPCVAEMKYLHAAYEKYIDRGFRILSVSLDRTRRDVVKFRQTKYPMPWQHAFVDKERHGEVTGTFEIATIPKPILIDRNGIIVAKGVRLRGPNLEETLADLFASDTGRR